MSASALPHQYPSLKGMHPKIGGSADKKGRTHGGDRVERPADMPTKKDADYVVRNKRQLLKGVSERNAIVYIDDDIDISGIENVAPAHGVTLVAGFCDPARTENDGRGPMLYIDPDDPDDPDEYPRHVFRHGRGKPMTLYGVVAKGPETEYFDPRVRSGSESWYSDATTGYYSSFLFEYADKKHGRFRAIGCEFFGWTVAALELGAKNHETDALVHRCEGHHCQMESMGYFIEQYNGELDLSWSFGDACRHVVSGFGYETEWYDIWNCVFGRIASGHTIDMHCKANNLETDSRVAGKYIRIRNCTFYVTHDVLGYRQEAIGNRGASEETSWVDKCHFRHEKKPTPTGKQGDAYRQETEWHDPPDELIRFDPRDNLFGLDQPLSKLKTYGAPIDPKRPYDEDTTQPEMRELIVSGRGPNVGYAVEIEGTAKPARLIEGNDRVETTEYGTMKCVGRVIGGDDVFELSPDANVVGAEFDGPIDIILDGKKTDAGMLAAVGAHRRLERLSNEAIVFPEEQIDKIVERLEMIEKASSRHQKLLDNIRIDFGGGGN